MLALFLGVMDTSTKLEDVALFLMPSNNQSPANEQPFHVGSQYRWIGEITGNRHPVIANILQAYISQVAISPG